MPHEENFAIPHTAPVMVLGGATLFPHGYMPLFIFEQRYRDMLSYALERDRMFCIGHARPDVDPDTSADPVYRTSTIGLVRACVTHADGTSHLMLSGLQRVELLGWEQQAPFRIATIVPQPSHVSDGARANTLALEVVDLCGRLCGEGQPMSEQLREHLCGVRDPSAISDVVSQTFLNDAGQRQNLLEMLEVEERLAFLVDHLGTLLANKE